MTFFEIKNNAHSLHNYPIFQNSPPFRRETLDNGEYSILTLDRLGSLIDEDLDYMLLD